MEKNIADYQEKGQILKSFRIANNRELEHISKELNISISKLEAIEAGDINFFSDPCFYHLFFNTYARYLGFEVKETQEQPVVIPDQELVIKPERKPKILLFAIPSIVVVILFSYYLFSFLIGNQVILPNGNLTNITTNNTVNKPVENEKPIDVKPIQPIEKVVTAKIIVLNDRCWVQVNVDEEVVPSLRKTLYQGESYEFTGKKEVRFWIGNAGAVKIIANGVEHTSLGYDGQVIRDLIFYPPD